jgi:hypothetical protein
VRRQPTGRCVLHRTPGSRPDTPLTHRHAHRSRRLLSGSRRRPATRGDLRRAGGRQMQASVHVPAADVRSRGSQTPRPPTSRPADVSTRRRTTSPGRPSAADRHPNGDGVRRTQLRRDAHFPRPVPRAARQQNAAAGPRAARQRGQRRYRQRDGVSERPRRGSLRQAARRRRYARSTTTAVGAGTRPAFAAARRVDSCDDRETQAGRHAPTPRSRGCTGTTRARCCRRRDSTLKISTRDIGSATT